MKRPNDYSVPTSCGHRKVVVHGVVIACGTEVIARLPSRFSASPGFKGRLLWLTVVLAAVALGIATTIGIVAVATILAHHTLGQALAHRLPQLERGARILQGAAGIAIGVLTLAQLGL